MLEVAIGKITTDIVIDYLKRRITSATGNSATTVVWTADKYGSSVTASVERHIREVAAWSSRMQFYGMSRAEETDRSTIPLRFHSEPRRFRPVGATSAIYDEHALLNAEGNCLLLGDPGAGKTTTLKRLANILLTSDVQSSDDKSQFPIVIRLRELAESTSLIDVLAAIFGIHADDLKPSTAEWWPLNQKWLGDVRLDDAIAELLDSTFAALLIDGLDEVPSVLRVRIERQLEHLARATRNAKIIVSCRTGDYATLLDGYDLVEIAPLNDDEIRQISSAWIPDPEVFLRHLIQLPYRDIADRPLLLTQLLFIHRRYGYLPEQPNQIYRKVVTLLLYEWDAERRIVRTSKYAHFVPERKAAFLSALAYHLTFRVRRKSFSVDDLRRAYVAIREQFGLPLDEAAMVAAELETHTGILVSAGVFSYEFSHLSLQEYLCAEYLVREPFAEYMTEYMTYYPAPVAVAVSLAAEPSTWFAALFLQNNSRYVTEAVGSFLARVLLERPYFSQSHLLGVAILKLYYEIAAANRQSRELLDGLAAIPSVHESVCSALSLFVTPPYESAGDVINLKMGKSFPNKRGLMTPSWVAISRTLLRTLVAEGNVQAKDIQAGVQRKSSSS